MIRVLQIVPNMHSAGLENLIMNIYRNIDRDKIQFDFLVHYNERFDFDDEIESMGGIIYRFPVMENKNIVKYCMELSKFFAEHKEYRVVHGHMPSLGFIYMSIAKMRRVPIRIMHSHNANAAKSIKGRIKKIAVKFAKYPSNYLFACSDKAGKFQYGNSKYEILHNSIDARRFSYNCETREEVRREFLFDEETVFLHIGRFAKVKNHHFLLDVFEEYLQIESNAKLLLVGTGELFQEVKEDVINRKLEKSVIFLGVRNDVWRIYQASDVFLLPSLHEGLPLVGIEAQAAGLLSIMSDTVTAEVDVTGLVRFLSLKKSAKEWANEIYKMYENKDKRVNMLERIIESGYDIKHEALMIQEKYISLHESVDGGI